MQGATLPERAVGNNPSEWTPGEFRPPLGLRGPHVQTVAGKVLRSTSRLAIRRERLDTPDGDFVDLDFGVCDLAPAAACVLLLHGLGGSADSGYVRQTGSELARLGIRSVALNFRSASGEPNRKPRSYHSGETGDLSFVARYLADRFPGAPLGAIGFSLGGNVLLKYLAEQPSASACPFRAAVAVSVPFGLAASATALESRGGRLYGELFLRSLKRGLRTKADLFPGAFDLHGGLAARTIREFDDRVTAPVNGFRDAEDYYRRSSSGPLVRLIAIPTLLLQAADDPLVPMASTPGAQIDGHRYVRMHLTKYGGHLGFVETRGGSAHFWCDREAASYLASALAQSVQP